ncbi:ion channel [Bradyrhizobium sp. CCBAU 45384]|uniref:ion channel n=1 Tax=Bradyrhizobium sp. CCBAU 45384 TaxID=858428 RepID=UPI0023052DE5|nr:ion channel [Bradyrhizobium sp. CCBAU 45384]
MDGPTRALLKSTGMNAAWLLSSGLCYWLVTPSPATAIVSLIAAIGSGLLLRLAIRIFLRWFESIKQHPPSNFAVPAITLVIYFFLLIAMWSYFYVFLARTAEDFPFCSGADPIDPKQFGLPESFYFTVISFATVGYGDIYACTSGSRWAVVVELSNVVMIGFIGLPALVNLVIDLAQRRFESIKSADGDTDIPLATLTIVVGMAIIASAEPLTYNLLAAGNTADGEIVQIYAGISAVMLIGIAFGALIVATNRMLGGHDTRSISLTHAIQLVVLAYVLFVEGFAYLYLLIDRPGANAFAFARSTEHRLDFGSASYFSLTTLTTTGFGDIAPLSPTARIAAIGQITIGIMFTLFAFGLVTSAIVKQRAQTRA